jgi:glycosidase
MNYFAFAIPVKGFLIDARITATQFTQLLEKRRATLPAAVMQNLMGSHDTDRLASMIVNSDLPTYTDPEKIAYNPNGIGRPPDAYKIRRPNERERAIQRLVVLFQMTYLGAPMIYYGDEVGMFGADDPTCRKPMLWPVLMPYDDGDERILPELLDHYRRMIALRGTFRALRLGRFDTLLADDHRHAFAFARSLGDEAVVVVLNNGDRPYETDVPAPWPDGARVMRADDPACFEPAPSDPSAGAQRPALRHVGGDERSREIARGRLRGYRIEPRSGGVFVRVEKQ